jgi:VWFA-related protein
MLLIRRHVLTTFAAGAVLCAGQDAGMPTFRSATTLIEFNVVALDASGRPVTDLKKEDILISERGKPRDVAYFRFDGASGTDEIQPLPAGDFSNRSDRLSSLRRSLAAIVMDTVNTAPVGGLAGSLQESDYQETTRAQILRYLHAIPPHTRVALYRLETERVTMLQDFTDDLESLRRRIAQIDLSAKGPPIDIGFHDAASDFDAPLPAAAANAAADASRVAANYNEGVRDDRLQMTLAGLESLGNRLAGLPGRKSVVWMSVGLPSITNTGGWIKSHAGAIQATARRLASQGIAIYAFPATGKYSPAMDILADTTGGRVVRTMNDPAAALTAAAADNSAAYTAGF